MNVLASGTLPLIQACEKSKPGFSSWNLSISNPLLISSFSRGLIPSCPSKGTIHASPLNTFCSTIYNMSPSRNHRDSAVSTFPFVRWFKYGGSPLNPTDTLQFYILTSKVGGCLPGLFPIHSFLNFSKAMGGGLMKTLTLSRDSCHSQITLPLCKNCCLLLLMPMVVSHYNSQHPLIRINPSRGLG